MRIAVLFYGRINKCIQCYDSIMNSIKGPEDSNVNTEIDVFLSSDNPDAELLDEFVRLYNPVAYTGDLIIYPPEYDLPSSRSETNVPNMIRHFINKSRVFNLLEMHVEKTNQMYDVVLSIRLDLTIYTPFLFDSVQKNTIYIPNCYDWVDNAINDQIAYGDMESMGKYMILFHNMLHLIQTGKSIVHPESLTLANIRMHELNIVRFEFSYIIER